MGPRLLLAFVASVLLLAAAALFVAPGPGSLPLAIDLEGDDAAAPASSEESERSPSTPSTVEVPAAPDASNEPDEPEREAARPKLPPRHERTLRVVDEGGRPVAGAEVRWHLHVEVAPRGQPPATTYGAVTNDAGEVTLTQPDLPVVLADAFAGGLHGRAVVRLDRDGVATLVVDADAALLLRAEDSRGAAVRGVPLVVRAALDGSPLWRGVTDGRGEVVCPHAKRLPAARVVPELPFFRLESLEITAADLARGSLTTRLPPGAPLEIAIDGPDGAPAAFPTLAWIHEDGARRWTSGTPASGRWRLPWFPLGQKIRLDAVPVDRRFKAASLETTGPVRTGVAVDVKLAFERPDRRAFPDDVLVATLIDPEGAPLSGHAVEWSLERDDRSWRSPGRDGTDDAGRLHLPYEAFLPPSVPATMVFLVDDARRGRLEATVDVRGLLLPGGAPLGTVRLLPARVAAAGMVVEPGGLPVADAEVTLRDARGRELGVARSGADGSFALRHPIDGDDLRVQAQSPRHLHAPPRVCASGAADLRLVLNPAAGVAGRIVLDDGIDPRRLELLVVQGRRERAVLPDADGRFEAWGFETGTCTFKARLSGQVDSLVRLAGIPVRGGARTEDPRLDPVDLRGRIRAVTVTVLDPNGSALKARVRVEGSTRDAAALTDAQGRAVVLTGSLPFRVEVSPLRSPGGSDGPLPRPRTLDLSRDETVVLGE